MLGLHTNYLYLCIRMWVFSPAISYFFLCDIIMGPCINRGNIEFSDIVNSECVDKASLIPLMNITLNSERRYSCVKRCRRLKRRKIKGYI